MELANICQLGSSLTSHWTEKFVQTEPFLQYKVVHASYFCNWTWSGWGQWHFSKGEMLPVGAWGTFGTGTCPHPGEPGWGVGSPWWPRSWLDSISQFGQPISKNEFNSVSQRENKLRDSLGKFITLHKARALYLGGRGRNKTLHRFSSWKLPMY